MRIKIMPDMHRILKLLDELPRYTQKHVRAAISDGRPPSLRKLSAALNGGALRSQSEQTANTIIAKRHLAELQLKLTPEFAVKLSGAGIPIETAPIGELVAALKQAEREEYSAHFEADAPDGSASVMASLFGDIANLMTVTGHTLVKMADSAESATIGGLSKLNSRVIAVNDALAASVSVKYVEGFADIEPEYVELTERLGFEPDIANARAVKALSAANADITDESVRAVKAIDSLLSEALNSLKPNIAAALIKEGLDPSEMPLPIVLRCVEICRNLSVRPSRRSERRAFGSSALPLKQLNRV